MTHHLLDPYRPRSARRLGPCFSEKLPILAGEGDVKQAVQVKERLAPSFTSPKVCARDDPAELSLPSWKIVDGELVAEGGVSVR